MLGEEKSYEFEEPQLSQQQQTGVVVKGLNDQVWRLPFLGRGVLCSYFKRIS